MIHDSGQFEFVKEFEKNWKTILTECQNLDNKVLSIHRKGSHGEYVAHLIKNNGWTPSWQVGSDDPNLNWLTYGLSFQGLFPNEAQEKFPFTASLLSRLKGFKVCAFSKMKPFSFIAPHNHPELGGNLLTYHLGLNVTPKKCFLNVNGEFIEEADGGSIVFDGSKEHFAINMSEKDRVILYMEFDKSLIRLD